MPTWPTDAQIDAHVLAEDAWEAMLDEADLSRDEEAEPATQDYMHADKKQRE